MGLPVPQLFLYEKDKNNFEVIDGQQRLMTIYYFMNKRFPKMDKRPELRKIFDTEGQIPEKYLSFIKKSSWLLSSIFLTIILQ